MKRALIHGINDVRVDEVPDPPPPEPNQVLVHITHSSICYTDVKIVTGFHKIKYPGGFGHDAAGVVDAVGSDVSGFAPGDRVVIGGGKGCDKCDTCLEGHPNLCVEKTKRPLISGAGGWFVEYAVATEDAVYKIPDNVPMEEAAFTEPLTTAYNTRRLLGYGAGDWVVVLGAGSMGWGQIQMAKATGAKVIAIDIEQSQLDLSRTLGADELLNVNEVSDMPAALEAIVGPRGPKYMIETGNSEATSQAAVQWAGIGGKIGMHGAVGMIPVVGLIPKALTVYGVRAGFQRAEVLDMMSQGKLSLKPAISHRLPLSDIPKAFEILTGPDHYKATKIVLQH